MYIINIILNEKADAAANSEALFSEHAAWFKKHFEAGNFLIVGPYANKGKAGVIIAQAPTREAIDAILAEDVYYPDMATYEVSEFTAKMVAENIQQYKGL